LIGTGLGTGLGAIIGHQFGRGTEGALIGAALGAGTGAAVGNSQDEEDRKAYARHASHVDSMRRADARAMTNRDVADMTGAYCSDSLIMSTIHDRGGRFDTSPSGILSLKRAGVSDIVIQAMQQQNLSRY
jgi:uncharacterized protein YcfJ